jgi:Protein of unknown function (DUF4238)
MAKSKNVAHRHHYVPKFLLEKFTDANGDLWVYDTADRRKFKAAPATVGLERNFYALPGQTSDDAIETFLARIFDGPGADAIEGLIKGEQLNGRRAMAFMGFVAAQMQRTPGSFQRLEDVLIPHMQEMCERIVKFDKGFREHFFQSLSAMGSSPEETEKLLQSLELGKFKVRPSRAVVLLQSLKLIENIAAELAKMRWRFVTLDPNDPDLILADQPVMLTDVGPTTSQPRPLGIRNPHIQVVLPFHRRKAALACWDGEISYGSFSPGASADINELTLQYAHRFVFASYDSGELLDQAIELHGSGPRVQAKRVRHGKSLVIKTEYI